MSATEKFDARVKLQQLWNGDIPLFQTFWLYYFAVLFILKIVTATLGFLAPMLIILQLVWAGFMVKPIWVSAEKYNGAKHWALLAKIFAVLIGIAVVGEILA